MAGPSNDQPLTATTSSSRPFADPAEDPPVRWSSSEEEKKRLFEEAKRKAAQTQLQTGVDVASQGLEPPPAYFGPTPGTVARDAFFSASEQKERETTLVDAEKRRLQAISAAPASQPADIAVQQGNGVRTADSKGMGAAVGGRVEDLRSGPTEMGQTRSRPGSPASGRRELPDYPQSSIGSQASRASYAGPLSEKEQMRRFYEARERVEERKGPGIYDMAPALGQGSGSGSGSGVGSGSGSGSMGSPAREPLTQTVSARKAYPTSEEEKDAMRRRYQEAEKATVIHQLHNGPKTPPTPSSTDRPRSLHLPSFRDMAAPSREGSSSSSGLLAAYPTADEEKERMRRRYQEATEVSMSRNGAAMYSPDRASAHDSAYDVPADGRGKGKAVASSSDAPAAVVPHEAPPLPPRPPSEYQQLLSPTMAPLPPVGMGIGMPPGAIMYPAGYYGYGMMSPTGTHMMYGYGNPSGV